ncbi:hypothetical protein DNTS_013668 [Danionella cerebrum]|uniref:non-specific serine/threonine protein kinase n=1 Tax=Danionella cerebrum TaxID=2873325 RepID=A0A553N4H6_9TELE|nr:hypothetical protein DNTS_013668 [Danionella translucida]
MFALGQEGNKETIEVPCERSEASVSETSNVDVPKATTDCQAPGSCDEVPEENTGESEDLAKYIAASKEFKKRYIIGRTLGSGANGVVYLATRVADGAQVAYKCTPIHLTDLVTVREHPCPVPKEVALHQRANKGPSAPEIVQLLDWSMDSDNYMMVMEYPAPCQNLDEFIVKRGKVREGEVRVIMKQAISAAQTCIERGVVHTDIKPGNILINPTTLKIKLIDFGCGEFLTWKRYGFFNGTLAIRPPEYEETCRFGGKPATVWILGTLLFNMVFWRNAKRSHFAKAKELVQARVDLSEECTNFLCGCLETNPSRRFHLKNLLKHEWFEPEQPSSILGKCFRWVRQSFHRGGTSGSRQS